MSERRRGCKCWESDDCPLHANALEAMTDDATWGFVDPHGPKAARIRDEETR